jgi:pyruvate,water dikinase
LSALGFNVPEGVVLPADAYDEFLRLNRLQNSLDDAVGAIDWSDPTGIEEVAGRVRKSFESASLPPGVEEGLRTWLEDSGASDFAVRSSATSEDLIGATYAGQYDSYLNVGADDISAYVKRCFASLFNARAMLYRRLKKLPHDVSMAVIVQEMVVGDFAGVLFTKAPRNPAQVIIELAPGIGEKVVSGTVSPNRYLLCRDSLEVQEAHEAYGFDRERLNDLAALGLRIESYFGLPQDIEFALVSSDIHILQSRPIPLRGPVI